MSLESVTNELLVVSGPGLQHILDVTLQEHRPFGEPMTGSVGKSRNNACLLNGDHVALITCHAGLCVLELLYASTHCSWFCCCGLALSPLRGSSDQRAATLSLCCPSAAYLHVLLSLLGVGLPGVSCSC
jgi:hypothetical protein